MSLIPHIFFPRSRFDLDSWIRPSIDWFDPFDELDHMMSRNMFWLNRPSFLPLVPAAPRIPQKYRITVDCQGHDPKSIKTVFRDGKLVVSARDEIKHGQDDYSIKEFKKTYKLPDNAEVDKLASFVAGGQLVVEVPLKNEQSDGELFPQINDNKVSLKCSVPQGIDPSKLSVTCKDRDLIIKAEDKVEREDGVSRTYYYKRCTLPENTNFDAIKCELDNNKLKVEAPLNPALSTHRQIPIEHRK